jgi:hypothetical protein
LTVRARDLAKLALLAGLVGLAAYRAPALSQLRPAMMAYFNDPRDLPALSRDPRVHFQRGAEACAEAVADHLPDAMRRVEEAQGRHFAREPIVGVYASFDDYALANGYGDAGIAATSRGGRAILSPTLCGAERARLAGVLTHELSHIHLFGWRAAATTPRPPSWFTEGLAEMVSDGASADTVSASDAARALREGQAIVVGDAGFWSDFASIPFEREPSPGGSQEAELARRQGLAFREAALFVAALHRNAPDAFRLLLRRLEGGAAFADAFREAYATSPADAWRKFRAEATR